MGGIQPPTTCHPNGPTPELSEISLRSSAAGRAMVPGSRGDAGDRLRETAASIGCPYTRRGEGVSRLRLQGCIADVEGTSDVVVWNRSFDREGGRHTKPVPLLLCTARGS